MRPSPKASSQENTANDSDTSSAKQPNPKAQTVWDAATPAQNDHLYLQKKGVTPTSTLRKIGLSQLVRIIGYHPKGKREPLQGDQVLVVPITNAEGNLASLELIDGKGNKHFLAGGKVSGGYWSTATLPERNLTAFPILLGEGIATCQSAVMALPGTIGVASLMNTNLPAVARMLRQRYPSAQITILADVQKTDGQPDRYAVKTTQEVGGYLAIPEFGPGRQEGDTDFNDQHRVFGLDSVQQQILAAKLVEPEQEPEQRLANDDEQETVFRCLADVQAEPIQWLWPGRIAKRKLTLEAGDPGLGKSQISLDHAAVVSTGGTWPDGSKCANPGNVIIISVEDDAGDTIKPRLEACGADMSRIFILEAIRDTDAKGRKRKRGFNLQEDLGRLEKMIAQIGGADLITIDPISAYVGTVDSYKNSDVRALLGPLTELASRHEAAVVAVSHLAKSGSSALTKISGSLGFIAAARAGYLIAKDPGNNDRRLFLPVKNNVGVDSSGFAYRIESASLPSGIETSKVVWEPGSVTLTADEVLAAQCASQEERTQLDEAKEFLADLLQHGPVEATKIKNDARGAGISERTLNRAKTALKIKSRKEWGTGKWKWGLPTESGNDDSLENVGNLGNVGTHASPTYHKYNTNNNYSSIPSKEQLIEGSQDGQGSQENHVYHRGQELDYEEF
ncbi:MAG: AAA family ATPase [Magnetococcales bacterium]|nr:AAA family ATPase [Magnetococcales bacterium]